MKVTDHSKLTYPCYLKNSRDGEILYATGYVQVDDTLNGTILNRRTLYAYGWFPSYFSILCDKDGNAIDLPEERKMTVEEAEEKIKELQNFVDSEKNRLYSADELLSGKCKNGVYYCSEDSNSYTIVNNSFCYYVDTQDKTFECKLPSSIAYWKFLKDL